MPELTAALAVYGVRAEDWLKFASFHMRAAAVMAALAEAIQENDRAKYAAAMAEFQDLAAAQSAGTLPPVTFVGAAA